MVLDLLDGRIARATGSTSEFGVQLDSLADVISFGIAPATLVFAWGLEPLGRLGWAVAFLWLTATAVRLARFNLQAPEGDKRYFVGLPSPAAASVPAATVFAWPVGFTEPVTAFVALPVLLFPSVLMVSRLRFRSVGSLMPGRRRSYLTPLVIAAIIAAIAAQPEVVLLVMAYSYLAGASSPWPGAGGGASIATRRRQTYRSNRILRIAGARHPDVGARGDARGPRRRGALMPMWTPPHEGSGASRWSRRPWCWQP